ncbi:beta-N-acetylhexosaminidase [Gammaproteobacteria bacterium]
MINRVQKSLTILLMLLAFSMDVFGQASLCRQTESKQLCDEIGQMLITGFGGFKQDANGKVLWDDKDGTQFNKDSVIAQNIAANHVGGVILFMQPFRDVKTGVFVHDRNIQNPVQVTKLNQDLQGYNNKVRQIQGLEMLPLFIGVDQEGGRIDRLPALQGFPVKTLVPQALGANEEKFMPPSWVSNRLLASWYKFFSPCAAKRETAINTTYKYASNLAQEISALNFNLNFSPVVDVNINPINPIIGGLGRSFSSNPEVVVDQAKQFVKAFGENKIISVLKHFPGHGSSSGDTHLGLVDVTGTYQIKEELQPYFRLIAEGYDGMIMTTHAVNGQIDQTQCKAGLKGDHSTWCSGTISEKTLTGLLRNQMGFKGLIVSDDMTMGAITREYVLSESLKNAINAGVDILIVANNYEDQTDVIINTIVQLVRNGDIKREKIDAAYNRIVDFKKKHLLR